MLGIFQRHLCILEHSNAIISNLKEQLEKARQQNREELKPDQKQQQSLPQAKLPSIWDSGQPVCIGGRGDPMRALYPCHLCQLLGKGDDAWKPVEDFGCRRSSELASGVLSQGCWRRCVECSQTHKANKVTMAAAAVREADKAEDQEEHGIQDQRCAESQS